MHAHSQSFQGFSISLLKSDYNAHQPLHMSTWQHVSNTNPFKALTSFNNNSKEPISSFLQHSGVMKQH